jgi:hypothetical protein
MGKEVEDSIILPKLASRYGSCLNVTPTYAIHTTATLILIDYRRGLDW